MSKIYTPTHRPAFEGEDLYFYFTNSMGRRESLVIAPTNQVLPGLLKLSFICLAYGQSDRPAMEKSIDFYEFEGPDVVSRPSMTAADVMAYFSVASEENTYRNAAVERYQALYCAYKPGARQARQVLSGLLGGLLLGHYASSGGASIPRYVEHAIAWVESIGYAVPERTQLLSMCRWLANPGVFVTAPTSLGE